ncbi:MAG TPA: HD domain-containing phosphohydrolase [Tepidisphaeraceae bacterium]|jgi:HD-GYP domain-containing protein (c-di-GMP phosphodiesterase class II)|nr:HD domain-containing phosphohydrolase [Tepidisphaeraceae bacterium]
MALASPVMNPQQPDQVLLNRGYVLEGEVVRRLGELGVDHILIDYPGLEDLDRHLAVQLSPERQKIFQQIKSTINSNQKRTRPEVSFNDYYSATREMITTLLSQGQHPVFLDLMARMGDGAVEHATAVAHLSLLMGIKLETYLIQQRSRLPPQHAKEVVNLGVAGMLHDMGKTKLPPELQKYDGSQPPEDLGLREEWETHPRMGYDMIRSGVEATGAVAVLQHHQHMDGTGFPVMNTRMSNNQPLAGEQVHIFARILLVADLYDRLCMSRSGKKRRSNFQALHLLKMRYNGWVDPQVLRALELVAPPFVPGTRVTLSDGTVAVVREVDPKDSYKPKVSPVAADGKSLDPAVISLRVADAPTITAVSGVALDKLLASVEGDSELEPAA